MTAAAGGGGMAAPAAGGAAAPAADGAQPPGGMLLAPGHAQPPAGAAQPPHEAAYDKLKPVYLFLYDKVQAGWSYWYAIKTTLFRIKANFKATACQTATSSRWRTWSSLRLTRPLRRSCCSCLLCLDAA
jgi:hypothetical protein